MLHDASFPFLVTGLVSVLIGGVALLGSAVPVADVARWTLPLMLLLLGGSGVVRATRGNR